MDILAKAVLAAALLCGGDACAEDGKAGEPNRPAETGIVTWGRDLDAALAQSASSGKPVMLLFQEVPG